MIERVDRKFACPDCDENKVDYLVWIDDRVVECSSCGCKYEPPPPGDEGYIKEEK